MKKTILAASLAVISFNTLAVIDGTPIDWKVQDDMVHMNCTGTILAGEWVLTAAHCEENSNLGVRTLSETVGATVTNHPDSNIDIGLWKLSKKVDTQDATFLSTRTVAEDEEITFRGFGQTGSQLNYAVQLSTPAIEVAPHRLRLKEIGQGMSVPGDSGSPYVDENDFIIGVHRGGALDVETRVQASGVRLSYAREFIIETINAWHHPTIATTPTSGGSVTVEVQSLHNASFIDNASATGDATITGGTCFGATVQPFDVCTYEISSNGYEGVVSLDDGQNITINKGRVKVEPPVVEPDNGSSGGGSFTWIALLGLFGFRFLRNK